MQALFHKKQFAHIVNKANKNGETKTNFWLCFTGMGGGVRPILYCQ